MGLSDPRHSQSKPDFCQDSFCTNFSLFYTQTDLVKMCHILSLSSFKHPMASQLTQELFACGVLPICPCYIPDLFSYSAPHPIGVQSPCPLPQTFLVCTPLHQPLHLFFSWPGTTIPPLGKYHLPVRPFLVTLLKTVLLPLPQTLLPSSVLLQVIMQSTLFSITFCFLGGKGVSICLARRPASRRQRLLSIWATDISPACRKIPGWRMGFTIKNSRWTHLSQGPLGGSAVKGSCLH